jgi:polyhydroxyalkanoate synthesis repressor PhaR
VKDKSAKNGEPITIKKYANRRLYNTATSSYVTLDHLCDMVKEGTEFVVYDAKTDADITRSVLTQIIFEEENKGQNLMPIRFLRQLIRFYGDSLQSFVPSYLEVSMETFARNQDEMRKRITDTWGGAQSQAFKEWENQARHNMQLFQQAFRMFTPFMPNLTREQAESRASANGAGEAAAAEPQEIADLKKQLQTMQRQIDALTQKTPEKVEK